ncbi:MAG: hypothetical protein INR69_17420 [Mucilaginibacter polytrichastri]|nr:hypothetical protein [Mucilaginibacter polytrichastri]
MTSRLSSEVSFGSGHAFLPGARAVMLFDEGPAKPSSTPKVKGSPFSGMISWGDGNDYPQQVIDMINGSPETLSLLGWLIDVMYGAGLSYEAFDTTATGKRVYTELIDTEVDDFFKANDLNTYALEGLTDYTWFMNHFAELIKNKRGDKIVQITSQEASFCRFSTQNRAGYSDKVFINANWPAGKPDDEYTIPVTAIDPYDLNKVLTAQALKDPKFILPVSFPSVGKVTYQVPGWHSLMSSGWLDVAKAIPLFKKALMKFQMTIKYVIYLPPNFWELKAKLTDQDWGTMAPKDRLAMQKEYSDGMNKYLADVENTGKAIVVEQGWDPYLKVQIPGFKIESIDDKLKDGAYLEDGEQAGAHIIRALGLTPSVVGHFTGKGMGAGSGSDARVHFNILNNRLNARRDRFLSALNLVADYNGWTKRMPGFRWKFKEFVMDTLDVNHNTSNPKNTPEDAKAAA